VSAADLPEYFRLIRDSVPLFQPADLILFLYPNDFRAAPYDSAWLAEPRVVRRPTPWAPRLLYVLQALREGRRLPRRWTERPFPFFSPAPHPSNPWSDPERARRFRSFVDPGIAEAMERGRFNPFAVDALRRYESVLLEPQDLSRHLEALAGFLAGPGTRLHVVYVPTRHQVSDRYRSSERRFALPPRSESFMGARHQRQARALLGTCRELGIPCLDLTPLLRSVEADGERLFHRYDEHMTGAGYRLVSRTVFDWWRSEADSGAAPDRSAGATGARSRYTP
jgi:hypothetical protein